MHNPAELYSRFVPNRLIRRHLLDPAPPVEPHAEFTHGVIMMADVMGYTALTERYSQRAEGVEKLKQVVNDFLGRLNNIILQHGGDIISLAGDSVFALWCTELDDDAASTRLAVQCGLAAQRELDHTDLGEALFLRMRVVLAAGDMLIATVGGRNAKWEIFTAGRPLAQIGTGLAHAAPGAVVIDTAGWGRISGYAEGKALADGFFALAKVRETLPLPGRLHGVPVAESFAAIRRYIPQPVIDQIDAGQGDWLAEFRRASTVFITVRGIDFESSRAIEFLQQATLAVQSAVHRYEGTFHRAIVDDKGTNMLCVWGIPGRAHEDDPARAVAAALAIQESLRQLGYDSGIGISTGRVMCGLSGGSARYEYTVIGDAVNLAARLMVAAGSGILCDLATRDAVGGTLAFEQAAPIRIKGKDALVPVVRPVAAPKTAAPALQVRFLGRAPELEQLHARLQALRTGSGSVLVIEGEPGVGKSRLVSELRRVANDLGIRPLVGHADAIERNTTYFAWREIMQQIVEDGKGQDPAAWRAHVETYFTRTPRLRAWLPLLNDILPLGLAETALTQKMTEQARAESTRELLLRILRTIIARQPVMLVLEDAHWMDSISWVLAARLLQQETRVLLVIVTRTGHLPDSEEGRRILESPATERIALTAFSRADTAALVCERLGARSVADNVVSLIFNRTDGHPLFSEELAYSMRDSGYLETAHGECRLAAGKGAIDARNLPATIEGIIASRVDRLTPAQQLTLKVASVFGRGFMLDMLSEIHPLQLDSAQIAEQFTTLAALDLVRREDTSAGRDYQFKHIITQEVTYGLLPFAQRRELHRAAAACYERNHESDLSAAYPLLAHHWSRAGDPPRAFHFLHKAGEQAFSRYANREAVEFLESALGLQFPADQVPAYALRAGCERILGYAQLWLGHTDESSAHIRNGLALLGYPIPVSRGALISAILWQWLLSARNLLLGRRFLRGRRLSETESHVAESLIRLSHIAYFMGANGQVAYTALRSLNFAERAEFSREVAVVYAALVSGAAQLPLHWLAKRYRDLALRAAQTLDDPAAVSQVHLFVSLYGMGVADWHKSLELVEHAERLSRSIGDVRRTEDCMVIASLIHLRLGDFDTSSRIAAAAAASARQRGDRQTACWALLARARVQLAQGIPGSALESLGEAGALVVDRISRIELYGMFALARVRRGDLEGAHGSARIGLQLLRESRPVSFSTLEGTSDVAECFLTLWALGQQQAYPADIRQLARDARRAVQQLWRFARIFPVGLASASLHSGNYELLRGRPRAALEAWRKAAGDAARMQMPYFELCCQLPIARDANGQEAVTASERAGALLSQLKIPPPPLVRAHHGGS